MTLSSSSISSIKAAIEAAVSFFNQRSASPTFTDIHIQALQESGEMVLWDDDGNRLSQATVSEWPTFDGEDFLQAVSRTLQNLLLQMQKDGALESPGLLKPYSYVLMDEEKDTYTDLMYMDDETMIISTGLLEGLSEDLDAFLRDLLKDEE